MRIILDWEWEKLDDYSCRVKVIGGWIVHTENKKQAISQVFVPDHEHGWIVKPKQA